MAWTNTSHTPPSPWESHSSACRCAIGSEPAGKIPDVWRTKGRSEVGRRGEEVSTQRNRKRKHHLLHTPLVVHHYAPTHTRLRLGVAQHTHLESVGRIIELLDVRSWDGHPHVEALLRLSLARGDTPHDLPRVPLFLLVLHVLLDDTQQVIEAAARLRLEE